MQRFGAEGEGGVEESLDRVAVGGPEGDVGLPEPVAGLLAPDPEVGRGRDPVADGVADIHDAPAAERRQDGVVERALAARSAHWMETWASMHPSLPGP